MASSTQGTLHSSITHSSSVTHPLEHPLPSSAKQSSSQPHHPPSVGLRDNTKHVSALPSKGAKEEGGTAENSDPQKFVWDQTFQEVRAKGKETDNCKTQ